MEPVSLGVSVIALFAECIRAYKVFSTASYLGSDLSIVKTKFQIEETRFVQWGIYWGYATDPSKCILEYTIINAGQNVASTVRLTLMQVSTLLKEYDTVSTKYDSHHRSPAYRGIVWALKDKERLETIVRHLNDFNDGLHQLLPKQKEQSLTQSVACTMVSSHDGADLDNIIMAMASMQFSDATKLARFKKAYQMMALGHEQDLSSSSPLSSPLELDPGRLQFSNRYTSPERVFGSLDGSHRILVEWKPYDPSTVTGGATARVLLRHRASHLAELMSSRSQRPVNFNILTCAGYFDQIENQRFGFVYQLPPAVLQHMPFTLQELLSPTHVPDLGTRFHLAVSLAKSLNTLHTSGWLHKSIRSNNIAIFQTVGTNAPDFQMPYLVGFSFSRPDAFGEETFHERSATASVNQLYRHPEVQGLHPRRYQASDDVYSFGLVLLEIALWKPLAVIQGRNYGDAQQLGLDRKQVLAAVASLPRKIGVIYTEAVEKCLNLTPSKAAPELTHSAPEWNAERLRKQNAFYWDVVRKLEDCRA
ncbi:hypothetical protein FE257_004459 [Aspergillus nanangensis]|uniref:Protein kinase domain-containing protein n=1 Tax=Aspergillus nanangensis TaxID=2582783 RepID=A0AAD4H0L6_ASPNN|nr:hypothetical protein FE257_004459 [Aspergillus nanangensis]